ncbi:MAG TPA: alpha/beta hydrolase [Chitinophagaceae bacterium]
MRFLSLLLLSFFSACDKPAHDPPSDVALTRLNQPYGTEPLQKMDIYLPANRTTTQTKVIVLIHGGAWNSGDKGDLTVYVDSLKKRMPDYAIFNVNYRLSANGKNVFPTQELDIKAAIEYIHSQRNEFKISDKFVLLGVSAGAHLALLQGYKYDSPVKVKAIVDFFGPADMVALYHSPAISQISPSLIAVLVGTTPTLNPTLYFESSPINFVTATSPPTIILQGGLDPLVPQAQSVALKDMLVSKGVAAQYVLYPNEGHGWYGNNLTDSFNKIVAFLSTHVN